MPRDLSRLAGLTKEGPSSWGLGDGAVIPKRMLAEGRGSSLARVPAFVVRFETPPSTCYRSAHFPRHLSDQYLVF